VENNIKSLSIVFPAFEEEKKIENDILRASEFLEQNNISGEIIVVDDGSKDGTYSIANNIKKTIPFDLIIIKHDKNLGKGFAVKSGILRATKEFILYSDVGDIVPLEYALVGFERLKENYADVANGSRKLPESIIIKQQDNDRKIASWIFNKIFKKYLNVPRNLTDTQCGFKIYKSKVGKELFSELQTNGFLFEIEIILRAVQSGYHILEFPLEWKCDRDSRIGFLKTAPEIVSEIFTLKKMFKINI